MEALTKRLKQHEGLDLEPRWDRKGKWVIGHGHQCNRNHPPITIHEAEEFLRQDIMRCSDFFMGLPISATMNLIRRGVCVELVFWVGPRGFLLFRKMLTYLAHQDYRRAALELYNSQLGNDYPTRASELAILMWEGE